MGKLKTAALMMVLVGCGVGVEPEVVAPEPPHARTDLRGPGTAPPVLFGESRHDLTLARIERTSVNTGINVSGIIGAEGKVLRAAVGQAGCGFSVEGHGQATVVNGVAHVVFTGIPADRQLDLVLELDTDADGKCTEADTMWSGSLITTQNDAAVSIDLATLEAGPSWMCFALNEP